jgi:RNA polymerase sigma factor (sigma-70 family)
MNLHEKPSKQASQTANVPTDAELLQKYIDHHDSEAIEKLIEKHSSLVMSVCYQTLRNRHDAEDAFQQTFFVLANKANTIKNQSSLSSWLYSVAQRESIQILRVKHREQIKPLSEASSMSNKQEPEIDFDELSILHEELKQIPEKYHAPLILCYLEHKTSQEAAYELNITVASVKASLETGRKLLKKRLRRRGLGLASVLTLWQTAQAHSAGWATTTLLQKTVSACIAKTALTTASASATGTVSSATTVSSKQLLIKGATWMAISTGKKTIVSVIAVLLLIGGGTLTSVWMKKTPENIPEKNPAPIKDNGPYQNNVPGNPVAVNKEDIHNKCMKKMKEFGLFMHVYHNLFGQFPPAIVTGPDGKTVHSWRVELLPVIYNETAGLDPRSLSKNELRTEYNRLIKESGYNLSKPWDSPENAAIIKNVPENYRHPAAPANSTNSSAFLAITGPGTLFGREVPTMDSVAPGTLMIVTSKNDQPWTKPIDFVYRAGKPIKLGGFGFGGFFGVTANGSARFISPESLPEVLKHFHPPGTVINGPQKPSSQSN